MSPGGNKDIGGGTEYACQANNHGINISHMWPFSHKETDSHAVPEEFQRRLDTVEHDLKLIRIEWAEIYDKIVHQFDRQRKRKEKVIEDAGALGDVPEDTRGSGQVPGGNWQDPIFIMSEARKRGL